MGKRVLVFQVINHRRLSSGIYVGNPRRGNYSRVEAIYPICQGNDCRQFYNRGQKHFVHDGFELDPTDLNLWENFKDSEDFASLREFVESVDGDVETRIVSENSILAVEDPE